MLLWQWLHTRSDSCELIGKTFGRDWLDLGFKPVCATKQHRVKAKWMSAEGMIIDMFRHYYIHSRHTLTLSPRPFVSWLVLPSTSLDLLPFRFFSQRDPRLKAFQCTRRWVRPMSPWLWDSGCPVHICAALLLCFRSSCRRSRYNLFPIQPEAAWNLQHFIHVDNVSGKELLPEPNVRPDDGDESHGPCNQWVPSSPQIRFCGASSSS